MSMVEMGSKVERQEKVHGLLVIRVPGTTREVRLKFVTNMTWEVNDDNITQHQLDDGTSVFARYTDEGGRFSMELGGSADYFHEGLAQTPTEAQMNEEKTTLTNWYREIRNHEFPELEFFAIYQAPKASGDRYSKVPMTLRLKSLSSIRNETQGVDRWMLSGTILETGEAVRQDDDSI